MTAPTLRRPLVLAAIMASMVMIAVEATIVSTAMPQIAGQLGDLDLYAWVFSAFLLTQTATTVMFGKLADLYGRKPVLLAGITIFLVGSLLCGLSWSMPSLVVFRLIQGVGAGAVQPISITVVGDLYSATERGRIQGWLASVWGVASVAGPLTGGLILQHLHWAWVFWINLPVGLVAALLFFVFLKEDVAPQTRRIDTLGAGLFAAAVASLMLAITQAGAGDRRTAGIAAAVFLLCAVGFVWQERRAADPMLAIGLWTRRPIATANAATMLSGMTVIGLTAFLPMYVQGVLGRSAEVAGFALTVMVLGWPIGATAAARGFKRFGMRGPLLFGAALMPLGAVCFVLLSPASSPLLAGAGSLVVGLGMGFLSTSAIVLIQDSVGWEERGSATAANLFSRNLGSTLGATVLGGVLNASLNGHGAGVDFDGVRRLLDRGVPVGSDGLVRAALAQGLHHTFWAVLAVSLLTLALALLVPRANAVARRGGSVAPAEVAGERMVDPLRADQA